MPLLLRTVRQSRWLKEPAELWLRRGEVPADPLGDLKTGENALSVWQLAEDRSNLERVVRAVAVGTHEVSTTGYVIFDSALLEPIGIAATHQKGATLDADANDWHRDLIELTGNKLVALTRTILENGETGQVLKKRLVELVEVGIEHKELPEKCRAKINPVKCAACGR